MDDATIATIATVDFIMANGGSWVFTAPKTHNNGKV
jgi:hypothetical protein